jgi:WD domain, G-beta repeat
VKDTPGRLEIVQGSRGWGLFLLWLATPLPIFGPACWERLQAGVGLWTQLVDRFELPALGVTVGVIALLLGLCSTLWGRHTVLVDPVQGQISTWRGRLWPVKRQAWLLTALRSVSVRQSRYTTSTRVRAGGASVRVATGVHYVDHLTLEGEGFSLPLGSGEASKDHARALAGWLGVSCSYTPHRGGAAALDPVGDSPPSLPGAPESRAVAVVLVLQLLVAGLAGLTWPVAEAMSERAYGPRTEGERRLIGHGWASPIMTKTLFDDWDMLGGPASVWSVAFSPDGERLVSGARDELIVWDAASGEVVAQLRQPELGAVHYVWLGDEEVVGFTHDDRGGGWETFRWDLTSPVVTPAPVGEGRPALPDGRPLLVVLPDVGRRGRLLVEDLTGGTRTEIEVAGDVDLWAVDAQAQAIVCWHQQPSGKVRLYPLQGPATRDLGISSPPDPSFLALTPGAERLVVGRPDNVRVWGVSSGRIELQVPQATSTESRSKVALSADGRRLAVYAEGYGLSVWTLEEPPQCLLKRSAPVNWVSRVAISPDGSRVALACGDQLVRVWDVPDP